MVTIDGVGSRFWIQSNRTFNNLSNGTLSVTNGAVLELDGTLTNTGGTVSFVDSLFQVETTITTADLLATYSFSGSSTIQLSTGNGVLDNTGETLDLDTLGASFEIRGGKVQGGIVRFDTATLNIVDIGNPDATFDGVEIRGDISVSTSFVLLNFVNGTTFRQSNGDPGGTISVSGFLAGVRWTGQQTVSDVTVNFSDDGNGKGFEFIGGAAETLTLATSVKLQGGNFTITGSNTTIDNEGMILVNAGSGLRNLSIAGTGGTFNNKTTGVIAASLGNDLTQSVATLNNDGMVTIDGVGSRFWIQLSRTFNNLSNGTLDITSGTLDLDGTLTNAAGGTINISSGSIIDIAAAGTLDNSTGAAISFLSGSELRGTGTVQGDLIFQDSFVEPGAGANGVLAHDGNVTFEGSSELRIDIRGTSPASNDLYDLTGTATFNSGTIVFDFGFFSPAASTDFVFLEAGSVVQTNGDVAYAVESVSQNFETSLSFSDVDSDPDIEGILTVVAGSTSGNSTLFYGSAGADVFTSGNGNDVLQGADGADDLTAGTGADIINGGTGNDELSGGDGLSADGAIDEFVFAPGDGNDTIRDFENGIDLLDVSAHGFVSSTEFTITDVGGDKVINFGGDQVTLTGLAGEVIDDGDFIFT